MLILFLALVTTCTSEFTFNNNNTDLPLFFYPMRVGTWNVMLQPWFIWENEIIDYLSSYPRLDVLALQEVWSIEARDKILGIPGIKRNFPYHYWVKEYNEPAGCQFTDELSAYVSQYIGCVIAAGIDTKTLQQPLTPSPSQCSLLGAAIALYNYDPKSQECFACILNELEFADDPLNVIDTCGKGKGVKYSHNGINGQLVLSRHPMSEIEEHRLPGFVVNRVNLYATIRGVKFGFGHFSFNLFEDLQPELAPLWAYVTQKEHVYDFVHSGAEVLIGDFNTGPVYQPEGYNALLSSDFKSVFSSPRNTWCVESHAEFLPCVNSATEPLAIDHIFIKGGSRITTHFTKLFGEHPLMSDHLGIKTVLWRWWLSPKTEAAIEVAKQEKAKAN